MTGGEVERRLRQVLLAVAAAVLAGTLAELLLIGHRGDLVQWVPFVLSGLGLATLVAALAAPHRRTLLALRLAMAAAVLGAGYGIFEHFRHNLAFELEIRPGVSAGEVLGEAIAGASPLLAPGSLAVAGALGLAAAWRHPGAWCGEQPGAESAPEAGPTL